MRYRFLMVAAVMLCCSVQAGRAAADWPQWRGPRFAGHSTVTGLPETWSETENIRWKISLPSWSGSTPVVWGDRIFLLSPSPGEADDPGATDARPAVGRLLLLLCIDRRDGTVLWERTLDTGTQLANKQNETSPSPVTDGEHVWAMTGTGALAAFTFDGELVWEQNLQEAFGPFGLNFGFGASPLLVDGKIVVAVLHGYRTDDPSYVAAFDGKSGRLLWRVERPTEAELESPDAYTTPVPLTIGGETLIVVSGGDYVTAHRPDSGLEAWRMPGLNPRGSSRNRIIVSPVVCGGVVYATSTRRPLLALDAGRGSATPPELLWQYGGRYGPDVPTPASDGRYLYVVDDKGVVTCLDLRSGEVLWGPEHTARGIVSASPLVADGRLYITNENAVTTVLAAGPVFRKIATNTLDRAYTLSSLAVSSANPPQLFLRTATHLYCIEKPAP